MWERRLRFLGKVTESSVTCRRVFLKIRQGFTDNKVSWSRKWEKRSGEDFVSQEPFQDRAKIWERKRVKASSQSYFYSLLFLQWTSTQKQTNKQRSYWRTPRTKTVSAVPADVLLLYLKCRTEENFHWLQDWMRHFPLQTPLTLVSIAERPRLWGTLIHPSRHCQCGRLGGQNCRACSGTPLPCSLHVTVQSTRKTSCVGLLASLPDFFLQDILQENQLPWVTSAVFGYHPLAKAGLSLKSVSISVRGSFSWIKKPEFEGILMGKQSLERTPATMQQMLLFSTRPRVASSAGSS